MCESQWQRLHLASLELHYILINGMAPKATITPFMNIIRTVKHFYSFVRRLFLSTTFFVQAPMLLNIIGIAVKYIKKIVYL